MCRKHISYSYTKSEQQANIATAVISIPISVIVLLTLYFKSDRYDKLMVSFIYGSSLVIAFVASTIYHWHCYLLHWRHDTKKNYKLNRILQILDRTSVLHYIASSCVPWLSLIKYPEDVYGTSIWIVYFIAAIGFAFELTMASEYPLFAISFYIAVGLVPAIALFTQVTVPGSIGLVIAAIMYLSGTFFFTADGKIPYAHAIWHTFVLAGSITHFINVYRCFYV